MKITTYTRIEAEDALNQMNELLNSGITISFSTFESEKDGETVFTCKMGEFGYSGFRELAKGYGDHMLAAFSKCYQKLNEGNYR